MNLSLPIWMSIGLAFSSVLAHAAEAPKPAPQKIKLMLNWKAEPEFGGFYAAQLDGIFTKHGLEVTIVEGGSGTPVSQMVAAGQSDFGISTSDEVLMARDRGADLVGLFAVYKKNPSGVMVHEEAGLASMRDVFTHPGTLAIASGMPYTLFLKKKFGTESKVTLVPYLGGIGTFLSDKNFRQQCFVTAEPLAARKGGAKPKTFLIADEGYDPYADLLVTRKAVLEKNPALVKNLIAAVREGWQAYLKSPKAANEKMVKLNASMTAETFDAIAETQRPFIVAKGR